VTEQRRGRRLNKPSRGFCVSADIEKITAEAYKYLTDPKEFEPPKVGDRMDDDELEIEFTPSWTFRLRMLFWRIVAWIRDDNG